MASKKSPKPATVPNPAVSTGTQQVTGKPAMKTAAKPSAPKLSTRSQKRHKKVSGKQAETAATVKQSKTVAVTKPKKNSKPKKTKMVRDSYSLPENEYATLTGLKKQCLKAGVHVKKSELLRVGLTTLAKLPAATLLKTIERFVKPKTGRPGKN